MDYFQNMIAVSGLHLAMATMPGPNTFAICCVAGTGSRRDGLSVAAGVIAATGLWAGIALMGVGTVIAWNHQLFMGLRVVAALYLVWIGMRMLHGPGVLRMAPGGGQPFAMGLLTALGNPFAIAFWLGTFLAAIPETAPDRHYARIFALIILQSLVWYSSLAILFSSVMRGRTFTSSVILRYVAAGTMILIGLNTLFPG